MSRPRPGLTRYQRRMRDERLRFHMAGVAGAALRRRKGQLVAFLGLVVVGLVSIGAGVALLVDRWMR
jgi:hypothetical protein